LRFKAESVELELELAVSTAVKAGVKLTVWSVLSANGSRDHNASAKHRLKLVLTPQDTTLAAGEETLIGDDDDM
jgi:ABC-type uncharacterized transport system substrate-binding protein